jgi:hypothetical protein
VIQKFGASLPEVSEPTKHRHQTVDTSSSNPPPAMLEIMLKMRQKASTAAKLLNSPFIRAIANKTIYRKRQKHF